MEENKKTNDFFNTCLRALNEGIKIFDDDFVNKVMEKVTVNKDDNTYYKKETWKNGNLIDKVEKRWKDGKLVFPEETKTNESSDEGRCSCDKETKCKECHVSSTALKDIEDKYIAKLEIINSEVDKLTAKINNVTKENEHLVQENNELRKKLSDLKMFFNKL